MKPRKHEQIGGGFFVFRRGKKTGRISVRTTVLPFEHPSYEAAEAEALRLADIHRGETFQVFSVCGIVSSAKVDSGGKSATNGSWRA